MSNMKILILGCSGSGKSTLTKVLTKNFELPVLHLDRVWHQTAYDEEGQQYLKQTQIDFMNENASFIVDGNYASTLDLRVPYANLIIWLQIPRHITMYRILKRTIKGKLGLEVRSDMADEFKERFDREYVEFLKFVWHFDKTQLPKMEAAFAKRNADCKLVIIKNKKDKEQFFKWFEEEHGKFDQK